MTHHTKIILPFLLLTCLAQAGCVEEKDPCGEAIGDATFNTLPDANKFSIVELDTIADLATLRYSGSDWDNICTKDSVSLTVNVQGVFTKVAASLHWSPADSVVFEVTNAGSVWSGRSANMDISGVHGSGPGIIFTTVDFTFSCPDSLTTLPALHSRLSGIFTGMYIDPIAYRFKQ